MEKSFLLINKLSLLWLRFPSNPHSSWRSFTAITLPSSWIIKAIRKLSFANLRWCRDRCFCAWAPFRAIEVWRKRGPGARYFSQKSEKFWTYFRILKKQPSQIRLTMSEPWTNWQNVQLSNVFNRMNKIFWKQQDSTSIKHLCKFIYNI